MTSDLIEKMLMIKSTGDHHSDLKRSISNNIKILLESRRCLDEISEYFPEAQSSIYQHGFADWSMSRNIYQNNRLCRSIVALINRYEPRLESVVVEREMLNRKDNHLYFRIEGTLTSTCRTVSEHDSVAFDSSINLTSFEFDIEENDFG